MKILHISSNGEIGGREKMLYLLVSQETLDPRLTPSVYMKHMRGPYYQKIKAIGINIFTSLKGNIFSNLISNVRLFENFDILVFHFVDLQLFIAAVLSGKPRLYRLSGIYLLSKRRIREVLGLLLKRLMGPGLRQRSNPVQEKNIVKSSKLPNSRSFRRVIKRWYFSFFLRTFFSQIIVNSRYTMSCAEKYYGVSHSKIKVIYNGVELFFERPRQNDIRSEFGIQSDDFVVGTVCRFDVRKRIDRLLSGFNELDKNDRIKLLIVGGGDDNLEGQFKAFVQNNNLTGRVFFSGLRENAEALIDTMDLFVLPSDNETFGLALVEAMLLEKPTVVFSDSGGPVEIIANNSFGYIIRNPCDLKNIVNELYKDPVLKIKKGKEAKAYASDKFSVARFQSEFKTIYQFYQS